MEQSTSGAAVRTPIQLITISREYGAGGSELGVLLGKTLGWRVLDHELVQQLAARLRCEEGEIKAMDEHVPSLLERLASAAVITAPELRVQSRPWATDPDCIAATAREVLLEAARTLPLIVVGHGGNCLFRDRADVLRVRVIAPYQVRIRRVAQRTGMALPQSASEVRRKDSDREHYLQRYYQSRVNDPCEYDLQINTGVVSLDAASRLVVALLAPNSSRI